MSVRTIMHKCCTQHNTEQFCFPSELQTIITAQIQSLSGDGKIKMLTEHKMQDKMPVVITSVG